MNGHYTTVFHQSQFAETQHQVHTSQSDTAHHLSPTPQSAANHQPAGNTDFIGKPIHFATGQFAGHTIRAELQEIQKADRGRKYARVDRRPLDPPPVVLLKLYYVYPSGLDNEPHEDEVQNYDEVQNLGLVCTVDLFPVPSQSDPVHRHPSVPRSPPVAAAYAAGNTADSLSSQSAISPDGNDMPFQMSPQQASMDGIAGTSPHRPNHDASDYLLPSGVSSSIVHHVNGFPISETSKVTAALVGATFVQPATFEYQGKKSLVFVFADLAVKIEGSFILRYRVFDIFSRPSNHNSLVIQAECYGGLFHVYSTKEFPGLQASTELTKQLARWGARLNIRETERKRRKKGETSTGSPKRRKANASMSGSGDGSGDELDHA